MIIWAFPANRLASLTVIMSLCCFRSEGSSWATGNLSSFYFVEKSLSELSSKTAASISSHSLWNIVWMLMKTSPYTYYVAVLKVSQWGQQTSQKMAKGGIIQVVSSVLCGRIHMEIRATVSLTTNFTNLFFFSDHQGPLTHTFCFYLFWQ